MTLSNPISIFGLHQATIMDRTTGDQFAIRVISDFDNDNSQEQKPLRGGPAAYPWDAAPGDAEGKLSLTVMQYDLNALKYFGGYNPINPNYTEDADGDAAGAVSALTNFSGTSMFNATTGAASGSVVSSQNPAFGDYFLKATGSAAFDVYLNNNLDGVPYVNDSLKITSAPLTLVAATPVTIPNTNVQITGGSGTIGLTTGDMAKFSVKPINNYNFQYKGGAEGATAPEFDLTIFFEKLGTNKYRYIRYHRVKANGVSFKGKAKDWASFESQIMILQDSVAGCAYTLGVTGR